ncbi:hypothetical protein BZA05DRAFT_401307 [Tricharina praecox]|uniref:uncharacterized protein n=1 Tax=Tricharina praecox TaxID=43433 RepID=UPI00222016E2|nr:uncharacterized protein BZA05DRAFT_401307 [Tricharina praecox]KAI5849723.1 hypothetical protein BZA05DRAFT_401307 [Tricharina praecox]
MSKSSPRSSVDSSCCAGATLASEGPVWPITYVVALDRCLSTTYYYYYYYYYFCTYTTTHDSRVSYCLLPPTAFFARLRLFVCLLVCFFSPSACGGGGVMDE